MIRDYSFNDVWILFSGLQWTVWITLGAFVAGGVLGLLVAIARIERWAWLRFASGAFIYVIQGIPVLMLLFLAYYGLALVGYNVPPFIAATTALSIFAGAYLGDIWRGCIQSVPQAQWEASSSLALTRIQQYRYVILPQAVRIAMPQTVGFLVQLVKNSSIASLIGFVELTRSGQLVSNATFQPLPVFLTVAAFYFAINYPLSLLSRHLENKFNVGH